LLNCSHLSARHCCLTPVIPVIQEQRSGESQFEASLSKQFMRPHLVKVITKKGWWSGSRCMP
jgi:hypothetical protein